MSVSSPPAIFCTMMFVKYALYSSSIPTIVPHLYFHIVEVCLPSNHCQYIFSFMIYLSSPFSFIHNLNSNPNFNPNFNPNSNHSPSTLSYIKRNQIASIDFARNPKHLLLKSVCWSLEAWVSWIVACIEVR